MRHLPAAAIASLAVLTTVPVYAVTPQGMPFQVNTHTTGNQSDPAIGTLPNGDFYVGWASGLFSTPSQDGDGAGVYGQFYTIQGLPIGLEWQINEHTTGDQAFPNTSPRYDFGDPTNMFKFGADVVWSDSDQDGNLDGVFYQEIENQIKLITGDFQINLSTTGYQNSAVVFRIRPLSGLGVGEARVCYEDFLPGLGANVKCRGGDYSSLSTSGRAVGNTEFVANSFTTGYQGRPSACSHSNGDFVVTWSDFNQLGYSPSIFGQRFDRSNMKIGTEFQVNTYTTGTQDYPTVCCADDGAFLVTWDSAAFPAGPDGDAGGVFGRRFDSSGMPVADEFQVNTVATGHQNTSHASCDPDGNAVVVWRDNSDGAAGRIAGQAYSSTGATLGTEFTVPAFGMGPAISPQRPVVDLGFNANFVVAWDEYGSDGDRSGVFAHRYLLDEIAATTTTTTSTTTTSTSTTTTLGAGGICGDPVDPGGALTAGRVALADINASDALFTLKAGVGSEVCELCVCDVNDTGDINASDALGVLQFGVGQPVVLNCPACAGGN